MLPIPGQQTADGIAVLFSDSSFVAMSETLERTIHAIPVSELVGFLLRLFDFGFGAHFLGGGVG